MTEDSKSYVWRLLIVCLCAVVIVVGVVVYIVLPASPSVPTTLADTGDVPVIIKTVEDTVAPVVAPDPAPVFDTFRAEPDGNMVVAGRASPNQVVAIMLAGVVLEQVTADNGGSFVAFPVAGPSGQPRKLSLLADPDGAAIASESSYIVAPTLLPDVTVAGAALDVIDATPPALPEVDLTAQQRVNVTIDQVTPQPEAPQLSGDNQNISTTSAAVTAVARTAPAAPTVLQADADGVRVVQEGRSDVVALDTITYDPTGEVVLSGRASGDGAVQIYIDNEAVVSTQITETGDFRVNLPGVATGIYTLRVDEVTSDGTVVSRIETPFKREEAADIAAVLAEETTQDGFEVAVKTVQPGATLWAIAEESLGNGIFYVEVYEANADLIRDPDLIYPGQIFRMPEVAQ